MADENKSTGVVPFFLIACGITWLVDIPWALATLSGTKPSEMAQNLAGLGAFGPTIAAFIIAKRRNQARDVFGRWRTNPIWILVAFSAIPALHQLANVIEVLLGGSPHQWFYPPPTPQHVIGLVVFSVGEEFGWRGFAYKRLADTKGPVLACLIVGAVWSVWHLGMWIAEDMSTSRAVELGFVLVCGSLIYAWVFEKSNRSIAVAIALHMGSHADNSFRGPDDEIRLRVLNTLVMIVFAALAARALKKSAES